jgi:molybdate transport system ATP-binding protein
MIDVDLRLTLRDGTRRFDLGVRFATDAAFVALYGPSGSGKSLTLQAMAGLAQPASGHVRIAGRTLYDSRAGVDVPAEQRGIGYLFQHYALFPHLTVRENVAFGLTDWRRRRLAPAEARRIDALLASFGLGELAKSRPASLSGGQQQRVALARALACNPRALLLDEPFAALNPMLRRALREELAAIARRWAVPVVMISHDVDDVVALAEMAIVIEQGEVVREVDLRQGRSRERVHRGLAPSDEAPAADPRADALRTLLLGAGDA